ncbi:MAG: hypothetical protein LBD55_01635 [Treponema sp.]|jgi:site-specific DNA-methyltransferase (adenine-specific)|nr:hypothetical protein [Treponema sp.]
MAQFYDSKLYKELNKAVEAGEKINILPNEYLNKIIAGPCENMKEIPNNSLHLMIKPPPYNISKEYDELLLKDHLNMLKSVFSETFRVLVNGGGACIHAANLGRKPYIPLSGYISKWGLRCI